MKMKVDSGAPYSIASNKWMAKCKEEARVLFDNGSEVTLVSNHFARRNKLSSRKAPFTLAVMGSSPSCHSDGKLYSISLLDSSGRKVVIEAFGVDNILTEKVGRGKIIFNEEEVSDLPKAVIDKIAKPIPKKYVDILIGNSHLGLQPACNFGFGCKNCSMGRCIY